MDQLLLGLRVLVSLAAVLGLLWFLQRRISRGRAGARRAPALTVVTRQGLGQKASVVLVDTDGKRLLLGVTEHGISVLHTGDAPAPEPVPAPAAKPAPDFDRELDRQLDKVTIDDARGPLSGSILDPGAWRQVVGLVGGRRP